MKIDFHGAARTVTGSKHLIRTEDGSRFLLDCGMFQGLGKDTLSMNRHFGFSPEAIDFVILSHAHIDHSGLLPRLVKEGFTGPIYCTPATRDLCEIMLADSAHIQLADVTFVNKRRKKQDKELIKPLYTLSDVQKTLSQMVEVPYDDEYKINDFIRLTFTDNGHILGSAAVNLRITEGSTAKRLFFSGDVGRYNTALMKDPSSFPQADFIIMESTYGDRLHEDVDHAEQLIMEAAVDTCSVKKGKLIIPAFSLGRTQEIVYALNKLDLHGLLPDVKIYIDSPLSVSATEIMRKHSKCLNRSVQKFMEGRPDPFGFEDVHYITEKRESQALNASKEPCIIISASGMGEAGRVKHHIMHGIEDPANTILVVGYAEPQSLVGKLRNDDKQVRIFTDLYDVKCDVRVIDSFSAHGDYKEMLRYLECQDPTKVEKVFLVHGDIGPMENFKDLLHEAGFGDIFIPERHRSYFA